MHTAAAKPTSEDQGYYRNVDRCVSEKLDQPISNALPAHACYLMTKMFQTAHKRIRLYSGSLERRVKESCALDGEPEGATGSADLVDVYADKALLAAVCDFVGNRGGDVSIIVQKDVDGGVETHPLISLITEMKRDGSLRGKVEVKQLGKQYADAIENHFMVMDDTAYRFEFDHNPCRAQANFGDLKTAKALAELFDENLFPAGKPVPMGNPVLTAP